MSTKTQPTNSQPANTMSTKTQPKSPRSTKTQPTNSQPANTMSTKTQPKSPRSTKTQPKTSSSTKTRLKPPLSTKIQSSSGVPNYMGKNNVIDLKKFNTDFNTNDNNISSNENKNRNINKFDVEVNILPHQQSIETIIIGIRDLFLIILDQIEVGKNPIPLIFASELRTFYFSLFLIILGTLLLLLASLMKSPNETFK
jgi:hypothetical protein